MSGLSATHSPVELDTYPSVRLLSSTTCKKVSGSFSAKFCRLALLESALGLALFTASISISGMSRRFIRVLSGPDIVYCSFVSGSV